MHKNTLSLPGLLRLEPTFHHRVWGGQRLKASPDNPIGEAWVAHDACRVQGSDFTLGELAARHSAELLGDPDLARDGFPLLVKFLDCNDWLSVQVHPNDEQAHALEGPGKRGKTEAWHVLHAQPEAALIAGIRAGTAPAVLQDSIRTGRVLDLCERHHARAGDTVYMPAGTIHALGPGLLIYEVQQSSDITYRVWDWDRPASAGRALHLKQSFAVADVNSAARHMAHDPADDAQILRERYFGLRRLQCRGGHRILTVPAKSCLILTSVDATGFVSAGGLRQQIEPMQTIIVPAASRICVLELTGALLSASL